MSEVLQRMIARVESDIERGVPFKDGMRHFTDLINEGVIEMEKKLIEMRNLEILVRYHVKMK